MERLLHLKNWNLPLKKNIFLGFKAGKGQIKPTDINKDKILNIYIPKTKKDIKACYIYATSIANSSILVFSIIPTVDISMYCVYWVKMLSYTVKTSKLDVTFI